MAGQVQRESHDAQIPVSTAVDQGSRSQYTSLQDDLSHEATEAARATLTEQSMTLMQGLRTYPHAVGWSVLISTAIVMEGFDKVLINSLFANTAFRQKYGDQQPDGSYELTATWQTALSIASMAGEVVGLGINGIVAERFGYRKTIIVSMFLVIAFIFIVFFAQTTSHLLAGQILLGLPWGVFQTITVTYAAEVCPTALRAYLTTYVNLCWVIGQFIASGVLRGLAGRDDQWSYKIPFALQWIWPVPIMIGVYLAPESPWWLVRKDRHEEAKHSLLRLTSKNHDPNVDLDLDATIAMMEHTNAMEKVLTAGSAYTDCFKGTNLRRTEISCLTWFAQIFSGVAFMSYSTYFYQQAGLATEHAFTMTMAQYGLGAIGTIFSWVLMIRFGRRTLYLSGIAGMFVLLVVIGSVGAAINTDDNAAASWGVGSMLLLLTMVYDMTVGPVCYALVSEIASTRLRSKTIVLARSTYNIGNIVVSIIAPRMLNPTAWDWGAKGGFFWAGCGTLCFAWAYFRLLEPKGRTYGELDVLFEEKVSARKFASTKIDPVAAAEQIIKADEKKTALDEPNVAAAERV
ncbi:alpha-glucoside permease [Paramyrothecium foliicola]|nr:alpha-glucoside permease [Paramyrothecium foliicola]